MLKIDSIFNDFRSWWAKLYCSSKHISKQ